MRESFLKALLHNIFGVFSPAGNAPRNEEKPLLVTFDQDLEGFFISVLRGSNEGHVSFSGNTVDNGDRCFLSVGVVHEFRWHRSAP
jgi:hypothetical protein